MARNVLVDAGFVVALLSNRDAHHQSAVNKALDLPSENAPSSNMSRNSHPSGCKP
jgi:predicted nucleic acid-binding protein